MTEVARHDPDREIRLFFSMDLANASAFKYQHPPRNDVVSDPDAWPSVFMAFFERATTRFWALYKQSAERFGHPHGALRLWKTLGDEILFHSEQTHPEQPYWQIRAFMQAVQELDQEYQSQFNRALGVKGLVWSAEFPFRNKHYYLDDVGAENASARNTISEFMGLEMDQGFRLGRHT
jgi:hypothetical protein